MKKIIKLKAKEARATNAEIPILLPIFPLSLCHCCDVLKAPDMIGEPCLHRWRYTERFVNPSKVVIEEV